MKKTMMILLVLAMLFAVLCAGCSGENAGSTASASGGSFAVVGDADTNYVEAIVAKVNTLTGAEPAVYSPKNAPAQPCIVAGNPDELNVGDMIAEVPYFGYLVTVRNGNVYILAYHDEVLAEAASVFLRELEGWTANGKIKPAEGYEVLQTVSVTFSENDVPYLEGGENASVHNYDNGHQVVTLEGVSKAEFEAYCAKLEAEGFKLHGENEINGNRFMTYANSSGKMIHTYWTEYFGEARIVVATTDLLPFTSEAKNPVDCIPLLYQMEGEDEEGYILRLADGRFLIVDGGNPTEENADEIYNFLKKNAPDADNIVIAAWYITHAHTDHCGAVEAFAGKYGNDSTIDVECFLFNPCETSEQMLYCEISYKLNMEVALAAYYPNVPVYKPLTGQVYTFGKTTVEILYTMSDFMPNTIEYEIDGKGGDYNVMSTVCIIDIDSTQDLKDRFFVMGDTTTVACNEMCYRYGDAMKCDFVQMSHHGLSVLPNAKNCRRHCATVEIYELIDPSIALWPASVEKAKERSVLEVNDYLMSIVDQVVIAGEGGFTFEIK